MFVDKTIRLINISLHQIVIIGMDNRTTHTAIAREVTMDNLNDLNQCHCGYKVHIYNYKSLSHYQSIISVLFIKIHCCIQLILCFNLSYKIIHPLYFYQSKDKSAKLFPAKYIRKHWGDVVKDLTAEGIKAEGVTMLVHCKVCTKMAIDDLLHYMITMASILDVKINVLGCKTPVYDCNNWIQSLMGEPSVLQLQNGFLLGCLFVQIINILITI